jgi:transposase InsO family protein
VSGYPLAMVPSTGSGPALLPQGDQEMSAAIRLFPGARLAEDDQPRRVTCQEPTKIEAESRHHHHRSHAVIVKEAWVSRHADLGHPEMHVEVTYIKVAWTFFCLCSLLDGCSRCIVQCEIRESMTEADAETIIQRARERFPNARSRIISENGPQFIANDLKEFIRICNMNYISIFKCYL